MGILNIGNLNPHRRYTHFKIICTVEPLLTDTPIKWTPLLSGQLSKVPAISLIKPYSYNPF